MPKKIFLFALIFGLAASGIMPLSAQTTEAPIPKETVLYSEVKAVTPELTDKPDLTIIDIYFSPNTPTTGEQFTGEVRVKVKNQGVGAANNSTQGIPVIITIADAKTGGNSDWANAGFYYFDNLAANTIAEAKFPVKYTTFNSEILRIKAWVDSNARSDDLTDNLFVNESDENNNFFKKDIILGESAGSLLSLELDKVALNSSETESGFILTNLTYNASDVSSSNYGIPQPSESISQVYQSKNIGTDRQSFSASLRTHKTIADARRHFDVLNTQHARQVISLSAADKEIFGDDIFCHISPDFTANNYRAGQPDIYYFICGFRYKNIFIDLQAETNTNDYKIPLRNLRQYYDNIINYDSTRKPPLPATSVTSSTPSTPSTTPAPEYSETLAVEFIKNNLSNPSVTQYNYKGVVEITVKATGQDFGTSLSDAYYIFTNYNGAEVTPFDAKEFGLHINGKRVKDIWPQLYRSDHAYTLKINLGTYNQPIKFAIGDNYTVDNSGLFKIFLKGEGEHVESPVETSIISCTQDYNPVCGVDGQTYSNRCAAENQKGVKVAYEGKCVSTGTVTPDKAETLILKLERTISELEQRLIELEKKLVEIIDKGLVNRVKGRILLQVEENGEAWYVDPESENKLYMKDGVAAYDIMRALGLGISNANLEKIPIGIQEKLFNLEDADGDNIPDKIEEAIGTNPNKSDSDGDGFDDKTEILGGYKLNSPEKYTYDAKLTDRLKGRILLQVESHGEAWYINPTDGKKYYLGDPGTAYNVMKFLSLGIKNDDLRKIQVGEFR